MGRWTQYDEDEYRLPTGMKRVGYDADTGRYQFQDGDRSIWQGGEGARFGPMTRASGPPPSNNAVQNEDNGDDVEAAPTRSDGYQRLSVDPSGTPHQYSNNGAYRTLFPFFLIIATVLLLVWRLLLSPMYSVPSDPCPRNTTAYWVKPGDSCWDIAQKHGCTLDELKVFNGKVDCASLMPGTSLCLPQADSSTSSSSSS